MRNLKLQTHGCLIEISELGIGKLINYHTGHVRFNCCNIYYNTQIIKDAHFWQINALKMNDVAGYALNNYFLFLYF